MMKALENEQLTLTTMSREEMQVTEGGVIILLQSANLFTLLKEVAQTAVEATADLARGAYDGFTHFVK